MLPIDLLIEVALSQRADINTRTQGLERKELDNFPVLKSHSLFISGIRRCGKSTLLIQLMKNTYPTAFYLNFEDPRLYGFTVEDFQKIDRRVKEHKHTELLFDI